MPTYNTPGVYIEEVSTLPPSVAEVATAIPAFIGYTAAGKDGAVEIAQVSSLLEYEARFGRTAPTAFTLPADGTLAPSATQPAWLLWYAVSLYFKNGGGRCYIVSVDNQKNKLAKARFVKGLEALEREDEPTLIVMPEIVKLGPDDKFDDYRELCGAALSQCSRLADRFAILDVRNGMVDASRDAFGTVGLAYGAAYHPYLATTLTHLYDESKVKVGNDTLEAIRASNTELYNQVKKSLEAQRVILPPSAAMAGVYARVDRDRGVWHAPANVGLQAVSGPVTALSTVEQDALNVVPGSGKSVNALRAFAGQGTLVWGARTLAGNDNEWRYIPVRRLFIMIEESAKKATSFAVFEPNDANTWLKVRGMLEAYLYGLWEQGALAGAKPEAAFYVNVGLGRTMTARDILEGKMIVEIGIAAVRPAEFIVLRFSHKLPEA